ncbi:Transglutaminase-like enzyme, predicted cysteine protease [Frankia sp. AiPs1]
MLVSGLALIGGLGWSRVFSGHEIDVDVAAAAILPVLLVMSLSGWRQRASPFVTVVGWGSGFVAWAAATIAAPAGGVWSRLEMVASGVSTGWARLLDTAVPAPSEAGLLLAPAASTWLAAAVGAELVVRTRARLLPALPSAALLLVTAGYATPSSGPDLPRAAGLAALAALLVRARRPWEGTSVGSTRTDGGRKVPVWVAGLARSGGAALLVVAMGVGLAGGPLRLPAGRPPVDPRSYHTTAAATAGSALSPLSRLAGWTAHPDQVLFQVTLTPPSTGPTASRLAVLDSYDGATWTSTTRFLPAGQASAGCPETTWQSSATGAGSGGTGVRDARPAPVTQDLTVAALGGDLVPVVAQPSQFSMVPTAMSGATTRAGSGTTPGGNGENPATGESRGRFAVAPCDGTLLRTEPLAPGTRMRLRSQPPAVLTPSQTLALTVSATAADARDLALPADLPPVLRSLATIATAGGTSPYQRAALLRQYLMTNFAFDPTAPAGHSLAQIAHFLEQTGRGVSEQFATTFVVAARLLGLPTRLVVGFTTSGPDTAAPRAVRGHDALAWAEIHFAGAGWLPFFPTPMASDARGSTVAGAAQGESSAQSKLVNAVLGAAVSGQSDTASTAHAQQNHRRPLGPGSAWSDWARGVRLAGVATLVGLTGYLALAWALPGLRRRRARRRGAERTRIVAAWSQAIDLLALSGWPMPTAASPVEVVAAAGPLGEPAGTALRGLATLATVALFGDPADDRPRAAAGRGAAAEAWRQVDALERALNRIVPRHRRIARRISPRTVAGELRRRRPGKPGPVAPRPPMVGQV